LDFSKECIDPVFKVPVNKKAREQVFTYRAQVNFGRKRQDRKERTDAGDRTDTTGWLVMRTKDLAPNTTLEKPRKGDQIRKLYVGTEQEQEVDYLIEEVRHESPLRGRPLLLYVAFDENRERTRSSVP